ncbi:DeoR family transcriptional regulator [Loigolactobacillus backii]|uniref:DeoR/GlpR family DNA-binding transcription regulator n=1 Tax=Loigolactobacillus backii TaxID=375175 RepID=UPI0007F06D90|nr:DeoR/GlpR family DNA-binding transcription regulator [Loigolactobacillus backii]ANK59683.1 DeoR family transcriptional regulator [Loigolactobacillus backii]ANK64678.1 DeoR family transcriptional regulator [Loigolactobacillus backii]ANK66872.1 DeoR family transcriptional regulator [Loigolactobacillus backii]
MLTEERHQYILTTLSQHDIVKSQDLITQTAASESTIRRDLQILEQAGFLVRVHGGAKRAATLQTELAVSEKSNQSVHEKDQIARLATNTLKPRDVIFLDAGTTTLAMIPYLKKSLNLTVVTNGVNHASLLADYDIRCFLLGGQLKNVTKAIIGSESVATLKEYRFNKAFLGTNGIHLRFGYTTPDPDEAAVKRTALQQAASTFFLADHTKFNQVSFAKISDLAQGTIITDHISQKDRLNFQKQTTVQEVTK